MYHSFIRGVTGYKKLLAGKPSQDYAKVLRHGDSAVCAVADGHGDERCQYSADGARIACEVALRLCKELLECCEDNAVLYETIASTRDEWIEKLVREWNKEVVKDYLTRERRADAEKLTAYASNLFLPKSMPKDFDSLRYYWEEQAGLEEKLKSITRLYGTTLNAVLQTKDFIFCFGIGDGDIVAVQGKRVEWLLPPPEQFSLKTQSLCFRPRKAVEAFQSVLIPKSKKGKSRLTDTGISPDFILVATDGFQNSFLSTERMVEKLLVIGEEKNGGYKRFLKKASSWLADLTKNSIYRDDITLVLSYEEKKR